MEEIAALVVDLMWKQSWKSTGEGKALYGRSMGFSDTCSAAPGSRLMIASAALLFLCVMAQAKGVIP